MQLPVHKSFTQGINKVVNIIRIMSVTFFLELMVAVMWHKQRQRANKGQWRAVEHASMEMKTQFKHNLKYSKKCNLFAK